MAKKFELIYFFIDEPKTQNPTPKKSPTRKLIGLDILYSKVPLCIGTLEP